ncbi:MAG TPA: serine/threonine-protein kinase [Gaiellaceae bacterium]|nr:serine/threonine-protein kinase [Gaiellaceae bacterium]
MPEKLVAGRYRLERQLGAGGMSEVWEAEDLELGRVVALKLLGPTADPVRFEREARAAASLAHPNVNQLFDYGEWEGRPYMVLELLPGGTLEDRLREGQPLPDADTERIAGEIAAGLAHAHARGLVHRDLKPANVLCDADGRAKIADFGIARMGGAGTLTEAGTLLGTAAYISPEQAAGEPATAASDVYSFGVILFRMLTGRLPFEAEEPLELVALHRDAPPPSVTAFRPDAPPRLGRLADACLAKDPLERPRDGAALVAALGGDVSAAEAATAVLPVPVAPPPPPAAATGPPQPPRHRRIRRGRLAALVAGLLAAAGAGVAIAVLGNGSSSTPLTSTATQRTTTHHTTTTRPTSSSTTRSTSTTTRRRSSSTTTHPTSTHRTTRRTTTRPASTPPPPPPTTTTVPATSTTLPGSSSTTVETSTP